MAQFVLVHGAFHGAWCWDELIPELAARGHEAHALDLPGMGMDPAPPEEATLANYAGRVAEVVRGIDGPVWLVGHSLGGVSVAQAAEWIPDQLSGLIYLTAVVPQNGHSMLDAMSSPKEERASHALLVVDEARDATHVPPENVKACFYHLCSDAQVERAQRLLRPWQPLAPRRTPVALTEENYGRVPRYYVECLQDAALDVGSQRQMYRAAGITEVASLDSDHSPFFSCPSQLADVLHAFASG